MNGKLARQIGNEVPGIASKFAKDAAIGKVAKRPLSSFRSHGSLAGLKMQKVAMLEHGGSGYGAVKNQIARYSRKSMPKPAIINKLEHNTLFNTSNRIGFLPRNGSSADRIFR